MDVVMNLNLGILIITSITDSVMLLFCIYIFFDSLLYRKMKRSYTLLYFIAIGIIFALGLFWLRSTVTTVVELFFVTLIAGFAFKSKWYNYFVLSLSLTTIYFLSYYLVATISSLCLPVVIDTVYNAEINYIFYNFLLNMTLFVAVMLIRIRKYKIFAHATLKQSMLFFITPLSTLGILCSLCVVFYTVTVSYNVLYMGMVCAFLLMLSNIGVFYYIDSIRSNSDNDYAIYAANKLIEAQTDKYREMIKNQDKILKLQHDYKNLFLGIISSIDQSNIEEAKKQLQFQYQEMTKQSPVIQTGNIIQTLIDIKKEMLSENNIEVEFECHDFHKNKISPIDIAVIFGNAFDNAVEACMKFHPSEKKIISVHVQIKYNTLVMIIKNPIKRSVRVDELKSTKGAFGHGYGILSMRNIAQKYNGEIDFECFDNLFVTYITMRNKLE